MIDMASKETRKQANKREGKQKVVCASVQKANEWNKQAWQVYHHMEQKRGEVCMKQLASW